MRDANGKSSGTPFHSHQTGEEHEVCQYGGGGGGEDVGPLEPHTPLIET